jgi:hypothetical protein
MYVISNERLQGESMDITVLSHAQPAQDFFTQTDFPFTFAGDAVLILIEKPSYQRAIFSKIMMTAGNFVIACVK